jgi:hypothetical protein
VCSAPPSCWLLPSAKERRKSKENTNLNHKSQKDEFDPEGDEQRDPNGNRVLHSCQEDAPQHYRSTTQQAQERCTYPAHPITSITFTFIHLAMLLCRVWGAGELECVRLFVL